MPELSAFQTKNNGYTTKLDYLETLMIFVLIKSLRSLYKENVEVPTAVILPTH